MKDLSYLRPAEVSAGEFTKAILPIGATECHGPHLPHGTDTFIAERIARSIAEEFRDMLLLPALPYGVSGAHMAFPYTLTVSPETMIRVLEDILESLYQRGIRRAVLINGHNGNTAPIEIAGRSAKWRHSDMTVVSMPAWWVSLGRIMDAGLLSMENGWHAGETETSAALALFPELVDMSLAEDCPPKVDLDPLMDIKYSFDEMSRKGSGGYPTRATVEKGEAVMAAIRRAAADFIRKLDAMDWNYHI